MPKRKKSSKNRDSQVRLGAIIRSALPFSAAAGAAVIVIAVFLVYLPSINGEFVLDDELFTQNAMVNAPDGLYRFWLTTQAADYWPVTNTTFWIEWRLWWTHSTGYHVTNLILHVAEALLIWIILKKLSIPGAFLAALIFAVHPVNVEAVAWISQRKDVMAMLFFLLSILWYLKADMPTLNVGMAPVAYQCSHGGPWEREKLARRWLAAKLAACHCPLSTVHCPRFYWLSLAAVVLAKRGKGSAAVLPVLLPMFIRRLRPLRRLDLARIAPFFLVAAAMAGVNVWFQTHGTETTIRVASFTERMLGAGGVAWFYLYKALFPIDLIFIYPQWHIQAGNLLWWLPLSAGLIVTAVLYRHVKNWGWPLLFAGGFFCAALAPVMGFVDVGFMKYSLVADHYQHIAIIGVIALASAPWSLWHRRARGDSRRAAILIAVMAVGVLGFLAWRQNGLYRDPITLYEATLEKNPNCWMAQNNLGYELVRIGRYQEAIKNFRRVIQLNPDYAEVRNNFGAALIHMGRTREAMEQYERALQLKSNYPEAQNNLGSALDQIGRPREAIEHYEQALRLNPEYAEAYFNLGNLYKTAGQYQQAIECYRQALRFKLHYVEAYNNLGIAFFETGQPREAIEHYNQALKWKPDYTEVYYNLALAYSELYQPSEAEAAARKALKLARDQGSTAQAEQIENWLNSYRAGVPDGPKTPPSSNSAPRPH
ncbi:MAG: tetratricopeptide repeat protein [Thermoguttaceae bacterium]